MNATVKPSLGCPGVDTVCDFIFRAKSEIEVKVTTRNFHFFVDSSGNFEQKR